MTALAVGARVEKTEYRPGDAHQVGAKGVVICCIGGPIEHEGVPEVYGYFVQWDDFPGVYCFVAGNRLREVKDDA